VERESIQNTKTFQHILTSPETMHLSTQINFWILCGLVSAWPNPIIEIEADNSTITNTLVSRDVSSAIIWDTKGDTSVGGCSGYVDKINKAYDEAVLMASGRNMLSSLAEYPLTLSRGIYSSESIERESTTCR
jgi:hypothetical protein